MGLLWCNVGFANFIELNKCFLKSENGNPRYSSWESFNKDVFHDNKKDGELISIDEDGVYWTTIPVKWKGPRWDDLIFSINTNQGTLTRLIIYHDEWLNITHEENLEWCEKDPDACQKHFLKHYNSSYPVRPKKYEQMIFEITNYAGGIVLAEHKTSQGSLRSINVNLNNKEVYYRSYTGTSVMNTEEVFACEEYTDKGNGNGVISGTAFFINKKGHLLTNNHVVEECRVSKINYFDKEYNTELIATDKTLDLALLKAKVSPKSFISFSKNEPKKRQPVIIAGYPLGEGLSDDLKINDGRISSLKGFENNSNEITVDIAINPGNSGGPIVNEKGQLVAIAVSGMSKDVTEGINFGIKASAAANFLKSNKISPSAGHMSFSMDDDKLVKLLEESTVYTFCE